MRKITQISLLLGFLFLTSNAYAIPELQLNIPGGSYVNSFNGDGTTDGPFDQGMLTKSSNFTLQAFFKSNPDTNIANKTFFISCAILTGDGQRLNTSTQPLTSININGTSVNGSGWTHGSPNLMPPHGVYGTYFYELAFNFSPSDYAPGGIFNTDGSADGSVNGYIHNFDISVLNIADNRALVFDLYTYETKNNGTQQIIKAPFSHNATYHTPEPASLTLLGLGLLGLVGLGKKRKK